MFSPELSAAILVVPTWCERGLQCFWCVFLFGFHWRIGILRMFLTSSDMMRSGGVLLRPWHLNWMPDAGFKGYVDPVRDSDLCLRHLF